MKTNAQKNRIETELRCAPSDSGQKKKIAVRVVAAAIVCVVVGWFVWGFGHAVATDPSVKLRHLLIAFLALRWLFVRGASTLKTAILITLILVIL